MCSRSGPAAGAIRCPATAQGSKLVQWLNVPGGPVASGQAVFVTGHLGRSGAEPPDGD